MNRFRGLGGFRHDAPLRAGLLLTNLGTPQAPQARALRSYLREFLSDPRVVELPRWLWWPLLNLVILNLRPRRSAAAYRKIWTPEGSPLLVESQRLAARLTERLAAQFPQPPVTALAMRYGQPSIAKALRSLHDAGIQRLLVLPMYPQYSATTTGSTFDALAAELRGWRWVPELRFVNSYHDHELYIEALAQRLRQAWAQSPPGELLLISFHGIPQRYLRRGDPYHCQCQATARLLAEHLALRDSQWQVVFQSRFGREPWLQPYCDETLRALPGRGVRSVDVICPGFAVDCLETLEEIALQNRALFQAAGGESFRYIPCLNDDPGQLALMLGLIERHAGDWPELAAPASAAALEARRQRATAVGAAQ